MKIKAAISPCPNDVFIFAGLINGAVEADGCEFEFEYHELETLNRGMQETSASPGRWDMAKISYANYPFCASTHRLLRCGGALGRGCGPLLLSNRAAKDRASLAEVLIPGKFTTANFLFDFFLRKTKNGDDSGAAPRKVFLPFDELYRRLLGPEPCQGVVIHEMRFTYAADGLHLIRDLGEHWESATGFPIPLGAVASRKGLEASAPIIEGAIRASLQWSYAHPAEALALCRKHSQSISESVLQSHIDLYVNDFTRDIGVTGESAVAFFLEQQRQFSS